MASATPPLTAEGVLSHIAIAAAELQPHDAMLLYISAEGEVLERGNADDAAHNPLYECGLKVRHSALNHH